MENVKVQVVVDIDLKDLIPGFIENRYKDIKIIKNHMEKKEFEEIRILGHSMKGFGAGYGFDKISEIGLELENAAKEQNKEKIQKQLSEIEYYLENIEISYE